jgi:hypothetical protein
MANRDALLQLLADCEERKIDFIVTKSISRFSRNTTECLQMVRKLLSLNVPVYFEKEEISTAAMGSELYLTLYSTLAENESKSLSQNVKWSAQKRFQNGTYKTSSAPYGYVWNGEELVIDPEKAKVVRMIFAETLAGCGAYSIANENIGDYASFDAESKSKFDEDLLKNLVIENGEFKNDETVRYNMVWDSIYSDLASAVTTDGDKLTTGVPGANAIVNYNYYYTYSETNSATGETTTYYFTTNMKSGSTADVQLGLRAPSDFESKLIALLNGKDIKDYAYTTQVSGEV